MSTAEPRWTRLDSDERRSQILAAARRLFSDRPYARVSMATIAEAAGVTRGLLHHYFGTKRDLYLEVVRDLLRLPTLPEVTTSEQRQIWARSVDAWMAFIESNKETWLVAIGAGETGRDDALHAILDEARELTATRVLEVLGLSISEPTLRALVRAYGAMAEEITKEWLERRRMNRSQARVLLLGVLPLLIERLLPTMVASGEDSPARTVRQVRH